MTIDERLDRLTGDLEFVATLQRTNEEHIGKLIQQGDVLTQRTIQTMDAISRLTRIVGSHEQRIEDMEDRRPSS